MITPNFVCYKSGNKLQFHDLKDNSRLFFDSPCSSVDIFGAAYHNEIFAFSESSINPVIYVYTLIKESKKIAEIEGRCFISFKYVCF